MLPEMLGRDAAGIDLQFDAPHAKDWADVSLVIVSNNPYQLRRSEGRARDHAWTAGTWVSSRPAFGARRPSRSWRPSARSASTGVSAVCASGRASSSRFTRVGRSPWASTARRWSWRRRCSSYRYQARCASASRDTRPAFHRRRPRSTHPTQPSDAGSDRGREAGPVAVAEVTDVRSMARASKTSRNDNSTHPCS